MKHFLSVHDADKSTLEGILRDAEAVEKDFEPCYDGNQVMIAFFAEPSTRTRLSFERAMQWLGGKVLTAADASASSSLKKGETLKDTFRTLSQYGDVIVMRHGLKSWVDEARKYSRIPVINAGNGDGEHPTQTLLDLYTIQRELGRLSDLKIMICGDLKFGRTVHSLVQVLRSYNCQFYMVPAVNQYHQRLGLDPLYWAEYDEKFPGQFTALGVQEAADHLPEMDVVYMTRIQEERMQDVFHERHLMWNMFCLTSKEVENMKESARILHPLPRGKEISEEVDSDIRAAYHERQVRNGLYVRISLLRKILEYR